MSRYNLLALAVVVWSCGGEEVLDEDDDLGPYDSESTASTVALQGVIVDSTNDQPIVGAVVTFPGGVQVTTDATGQFGQTVATGTVVLTVSADSFVTFSKEFGVTSQPVLLNLELAPQATAQTVSTGGSAVTAGDATLTFPAGSFASNTDVSATWLDNTQLLSAPGPWGFYDPTDAAFLVDSVLVLEAPSAPQNTVTFEVPVSATATTSNIALFTLEDGAWTNPLAPDSVTSQVATFSIPVTSFATLSFGPSLPVTTVIAVAGMEDVRHLCVVRGASVTVERGMQTLPGTRGFALMGGDVIHTGIASIASICVPGGSHIDLAAEGSFLIYSEPTVFGKITRGLSKLMIRRGLRNIDVRTRGAVAAVRGTVFTLSSQSCEGQDVDGLEVSEGLVTYTAGELSRDYGEGQRMGSAAACDCLLGTWVTDSGMPACGAFGNALSITTVTKTESGGLIANLRYGPYENHEGLCKYQTFDDVPLSVNSKGEATYTLPEIPNFPVVTSVTLKPSFTCVSGKGTVTQSGCSSCPCTEEGSQTCTSTYSSVKRFN